MMVLVLALAAAAVTQARAQAERLDHHGLAIPRLRALCATRAPGSLLELEARQRVLRDSAFKPERRADADLWSALGCVSAMLYVKSPIVTVRGMTAQVPNVLQASSAFSRVSQLRPTDSVAAIGLATIVLDLGEGSDVTLLLAQIHDLSRVSYDAVRAGVTSPIVLRMCTEFALVAADFATARRCMDRALEQGADSSWHLERAAILSFLIGNDFAGAAWFEGALAVAHDSAAQADIAWRVKALIDTVAIPPARIREEWRSLSDSERIVWLRRNVEHGAALRGDDELYFRRLAGSLLSPRTLDPVLARCPPVIFRNGAEQDADHSACASGMLGGAKPIALSGQLLRLWNPATGAPIGVIGYSLERQGLAPDTGRFDSRTVSVALNVRQFEWETGGWVDTTLRATLPLPSDYRSPPVTGYLMLPLFRGTLTWTFAALQTGHYGAISTEGPLALGDRGYTLSDLVLGVTEQGLSLPLDGDTITLAPLNIVKRKKPVELYYQLRTENTTAELHTDIVLHRIVKGEIMPDAEITMSSRTTLHSGINAMHRELDIGSLVSGDHQLDLKLRDGAGNIVAQRTVNLLVR
jgi:hypothetical protein